ncbi:MAG TPA: aldehyde dehydrogenase family protein, partial [Acidimicrobiales bacterium]|nr:aldehyde dehydrogenase family protein [Acidimicrobiales bacterium]
MPPLTLRHDTDALRDLARSALARCGADLGTGSGPTISARTPLTGEDLFPVPAVDAAGVSRAVEQAHEAFLEWRTVPAPVRGGLIKRYGTLLADHLDDLALLVQVEVGKIRAEARGEVQEMIDICDFAVGLSRQLEGRTMPSERPGHRLMETWHPLGVVAVISAFNFPVAVWSWNAAIALVCGDTVVWKPSELTPLTALACSALLDQAAAAVGAPAHLNVPVVCGPDEAGPLLDDPRVALVSATGSERMGAQVAPRVAARFGRCLLELGGNNAAIVTPSADLDLAVRAIVFAAAGTAGQRCTTLRRVIVHESVADELVTRIAATYLGLTVGDPFEDGTLVGPVVGERAEAALRTALDEAVAAGGEVVVGGERVPVEGAPDAVYLRPALVR